MRRILCWTGGHPYLTQRLCQAVAESIGSNPKSQIQNPKSIDLHCERLFLSSAAQERDDNLLFVRERVLKSEADPAGLLDLYARVCDHKPVAVDDTNALVSVLRLSGITRAVNGWLRPRNRIYARVFDRRWIRQHMPDAELRRQRAAYRRGVLRAVGLASGIVAVLAVLAGYAFTQRNAATRNARVASAKTVEATANAQRAEANAQRADREARQKGELAEQRAKALRRADEQTRLATRNAELATQRAGALRAALGARDTALGQAQRSATRIRGGVNGPPLNLRDR